MYIFAIIVIIISILSIMYTWLMQVKRFERNTVTIICALTAIMMVPFFGDDSYFLSAFIRFITMVIALCYFLYQAISKIQDKSKKKNVIIASVVVIIMIIIEIMKFSTGSIVYLFAAIFEGDGLNDLNIFARVGSALACYDLIILLGFDWIITCRTGSNKLVN